MQRTYTYKCFGLCFEVPFEIPYLINSTNAPQVWVSFGTTPKSLDITTQTGPYYELNANEFLMSVDDVAKYYTTKNKVIIEPVSDVPNSEISVFFLGSVMGFLLQRNNILPFHGSAIRKNHNTIIFTGNSGAGKSTIAAYFVQQGWDLIADDICAIDIDDNKLCLHHGIQRSKLWNQSIRKLSLHDVSKLRVRESMEKFHVKIDECENTGISNPLLIVNLRIHNKPKVEIKEINGLHKFQSIQQNVYRKLFCTENQTKFFFPHLQKLSEIKLIRIFRPSQGFFHQEIYKHVNNQINHAQ
ncbi:phosphoenolpyruvate carboxykinase (ATP) [Bacteroidales bacterium]|nr:phosphoenolpyruvate carboxykinase (ATP) [Bacteroidales bacterium]